ATLKELISQTMVRWSQEDQIQDPELVRIMYTLLCRQYDSIGELLQALRKAYTISAASVKDTINLLAALGQIRSLLRVRMGKEEELLMINGLGYGINIILFISLCKDFSYVSKSFHCRSWMKITARVRSVLSLIKTLNSIGPNISSLGYTTSIQISAATYTALYAEIQAVCVCQTRLPKFNIHFSCKNGNVLAVVTYLAGCGLQSCPVLLAKGYPDIGWNPIEGERYLSFLRFAVFVNSESVEENASVVVKLLIR
ncbi:RYR3 protein, partial [Aegotheles bennettii]|nr:RYR3 protein [Aegotheles bennettii]